MLVQSHDTDGLVERQALSYYHRRKSGSCSLSVKREIRHQSASLHLAVSMGLISCVNRAKHYMM